MQPQDWIAAGPIGVVALFLVYLMRLFVQQTREGKKDLIAQTASSVAQANAERDVARRERDEAYDKLDDQEEQCRRELAEMRDFYENLLDKTRDVHLVEKKEMQDQWKTTRNFLYQRIAHLEKLLYGKVQTAPPDDL